MKIKDVKVPKSKILLRPHFSSEIIQTVNGSQWQSVAVIGSQWQSVAVSGSQLQSVAVCGSLWQS